MKGRFCPRGLFWSVGGNLWGDENLTAPPLYRPNARTAVVKETTEE